MSVSQKQLMIFNGAITLIAADLASVSASGVVRYKKLSQAVADAEEMYQEVLKATSSQTGTLLLARRRNLKDASN